MPGLQRLPKDALVLVCDARKALFLRNAGTEIHPDLELVGSREAERSSEERDLKGTPPGRKPDFRPADGTHGPKSAMEPPDYARLDEERFAADLASECPKIMGEVDAKQLVIAAPSRMLGALRAELPSDLRNRLLAEIPKALTRHPIGNLAGHLVAEW